jgi:hypothetical protein
VYGGVDIVSELDGAVYNLTEGEVVQAFTGTAMCFPFSLDILKLDRSSRHVATCSTGALP